MVKSLPANPSLEHLKNEAKSILKACRKGDSSCCEILHNLRQFQGKPEQEVLSSAVSLSEVQFALAMHYGFKSWNDIKFHIERLTGRIKVAAPTKEPGNTYARGMSAVLSYLGTDISYDRVMGLSGAAFILQVDTGGPFLDGELDCAWWPNDAWGFDLGLPILAQAVGRSIRKIRCNRKAYSADPAAEYQQSLAPALEKSLKAGRPVLAEYDHCFIVTATDNQKPPLLGYGTRGKSTLFEDVIRIADYPWSIFIFGEKNAEADPKAVDEASLRHIVALFHEQVRGAEAAQTQFSGKRAWEEWLKLLHRGIGCDNNMLIHLRYGRRSAVAYLQQMIKRHRGVTATHLTAAAGLYQQILDELMKQGLPYNRVQNGEDENQVRKEYTAMIETVAGLEAQAVAELESALTR